MIMFLYRIINIKAQIDFAVSTGAVVNTILIFGVLYFLTLIYNLMQVKLANPIELLRGGNVGEKEPKSKWLIAIIGLGCLAGDIILRLPQRALFRCFHCSLSQCFLSSSERIFYLFQEAL